MVYAKSLVEKTCLVTLSHRYRLRACSINPIILNHAVTLNNKFCLISGTKYSCCEYCTVLQLKTGNRGQWRHCNKNKKMISHDLQLLVTF
jgi:hypothetical protein